MKTKKFEGKTEQEALEKVRDELGLSAIVLSIKKKQCKGFRSLFKKPTIVVTAAYDENETKKDKVLAAALEASQAARKAESFVGGFDAVEPNINTGSWFVRGDNDFLPNEMPSDMPVMEDPAASSWQTNSKDLTIAQQQATIRQLESMLARLTEQDQTSNESQTQNPANMEYENNMIQMLYDSLVGQGVSPEIAVSVLEDANALSSAEKQDINLLVKIVYNKIMAILGEPRTLVGQETGAGYTGATQVVVFMGPTGVGKTTTIAKLSSILLLNHHKQVGLITADTYRIAAVEQLRTYAEIMGLNLKVIYSGDEILQNVDHLKETHDVILVDTAGRSHNNRDTIQELKDMLELIPDSSKFLVLSVTTKQEDLLSIIKTYEAISDFDLIFTKLDETGSLGILLNICYLTGRRASYVSFGQNVPEDIEKIQPDKIAKALMGTGWSANGSGGPGFSQGRV